MILQLFSFPIHLLLTHGYAALFAWSVLEGEIGLMLAGWLASEGMVFEYSKVVAVAIAGAFVGDLSVFLAGRLFEKRAMAWLDAHPRKKGAALRWIRRWGPYVIVFERFIYGTHIPVLLTLGMSGYRLRTFLFFDIIGIVLWAFAFVSAGYYFGNAAINLIFLAQKNVVLVLFVTAFFLLTLLSKSKDSDA